jgi:transcriptional regulator NrdR family protein
LIANPHRLQPIQKPVTVKKTFKDKLYTLLKEDYPDVYISSETHDRVYEAILKVLKDTLIQQVSSELVDAIITKTLLKFDD